MKKTLKTITVVALLAFSAGQLAAQEVKNVIMMIGDGMGLAHVQATMMASGQLNIERAQYIGLSKTYSANNRVTDSAAGGTALAAGVKTNNTMLGMTPDGKHVQNVREKAQAKGKATGVVVTKDVTDATPAAYLSHVESRKMAAEIALAIADSGVDVVLGGGRENFLARTDGVDLGAEMTAKGYKVITKQSDIKSVKSGKVIGLFAKKHMKKMVDGRGDYLPEATKQALTILENNSGGKGFFLMVEGSQIDTGAHANNAEVVVGETLDFDRAVGVAFDFADRNPGTLVIVTADHETGGLTIPSGSEDFMLSDQGVEIKFSTKGHSAIMVPVYAYGTGAQAFSTFMENTDIPAKIAELCGF